jgi:tRNA A-37 threonylcarbamoyl transferase component Bud32
MRAPGTLAMRAEPLELREQRDGDRVLYVTPEFESAALALGLLAPGGLERILARAAGPSGRSRTAIVSLPGRGERLHLRPLHHGGLLHALRRDRLFGLARPLAELRAHARLRAAGAPVPIPVLLAARRERGFYRAALATIYEEDTLDGIALLASRAGASMRRRAARAAGSAVRALHDAGGRHPDLHIANLLFRERGGRVEALVVDLDRARVSLPLGAGGRMAELMRLHRSLVKRGLLAEVGARGCASFFASYTAGDRELRGALLRHLPRERARLAIHAWGWRLGGSAGPGGA